MARIKNVCFAGLVMVSLAGCGVVMSSPKVTEGIDETANVRVRTITAETVHQANLAAYTPQSLPAAFSMPSAGSAREASSSSTTGAKRLTSILPPAVPPQPYRIGVSDVVLLSTPQVGGSVEELTGLLAAQNARQGYTVQNGGSINVPNVGRIQIAGSTISEAEDLIFQKLLENQIDPAFSLEIAEFNSQKVSVGGAVEEPTIVPITFTPVYLDEALAAAGGINAEGLDQASVRLYRDGQIYQIPHAELYSDAGLSRIRLIDGDAVFVDTGYDLRQAERRENFSARQDFGAEKRDYVYVTGEVRRQKRFALPYENTASLTDALFDEAGGIEFKDGDVSEIYVLRASSEPREFGAITAWNLDARNVAAMTLAASFELRPNDIVFVASQPITRWNRVISQLLPTLSVVNTGSNLADG